MTCSVVHNNIRTVLDEASAVYSLIVDQGGHPNMDYAGYACHVSLNRLRSILNNPSLSADRVESLLRQAARRHSEKQPENRDWVMVMARYISRHANDQALN